MSFLFEQTTISITIPLAAWVCFIFSVPAMIFYAGCRYGRHRAQLEEEDSDLDYLIEDETP